MRRLNLETQHLPARLSQRPHLRRRLTRRQVLRKVLLAHSRFTMIADWRVYAWNVHLLTESNNDSGVVGALEWMALAHVLQSLFLDFVG